MLHIILLILKLIGIVLLSVIGVLLVAILLILLVPIRYNLKAEKNDSIGAVFKVGWLLRILFFKAEFQDSVLNYYLKVFGITIMSNLTGKKKKQKKKQKKKSIKKVKSKSEKPKQDKKKKALQLKEDQLIVPTPKIEPTKEIERTRNELVSKGSSNKFHQKKKKDSIWVEIKNKYKYLLRKIEKIRIRISDFFSNISEKVKKIFSFFEGIQKKFLLCRLFLEDESNILGIKLSFLSIKKVLKHLAPKRIAGNIQFGTGDPCTTGQALGAISLIYAYCGGGIEVIPNFEEAIIEGHIQAKGRIRIGTLLIIGIRLILNDSFKQLLNNFKKFKEEI